MECRKAEHADLSRIMEIIKDAQESLKELGIDQWQNGYPSKEVILHDMDCGYGYVFLEEGNIIATAAVSFDGEETYERIYEGDWLSTGNYAVIHRLAVARNHKGKGLSHEVMKQIELLCLHYRLPSIKIDTHEDNFPMQHVIKKNGYTHCGVIYVEDGTKRLAFEKLLN